MKISEVLIREFPLRGRSVLTSAELRVACERFGFDFETTKKVLLNKGYLIRIFRGVYYLKDYNEKRTGVIRYSADELLAEGMRLKGIKNWYFGLDTALKMLNVTHEVLAVKYVLNDTFNRVRPLKILGDSFFFIKVKPELFTFGILDTITPNNLILHYSDLEKTILDMAYLAGKSGKPIKPVLDEYAESLTRMSLHKYAGKYSKRVAGLVS